MTDQPPAPFDRTPVEQTVKPETPRSPLGMALASTIELGMVTSRRSLQVDVGPSEIGYACQRRLAYQLAGTPPVNFSDPMRLLVGTGIHEALASIFLRLDAGSGRFLVEHRVTYRGVSGSLDLYDRWLRTLIDWKTCSKARLTKYIAEGSPPNYVTQVNIYAAGLAAQGITVDKAALVYLPYDGPLANTWADEITPNVSIADAAIDRAEALRGADPGTTPPSPDRFCGYCAHYQPRSTDPSTACCGLQQGDHHDLPTTVRPRSTPRSGPDQTA